ncbi:uncharacterized protein METZ01_LOCUS286870, partial [marine metagenome]
VDKLAAVGFPAAQFLSLDTDYQELQRCQIAEKIQLGETTRRGWGCSGDVGEGAECVRADRDRVAGELSGSNLVIIVAGLGGGLGGGGAAVVGEIAAECGALVVALVIEPLDLEGRTETARLSLRRLLQVADTVVRMPNQAVMEKQRAGCSVLECFEASNNHALESLIGFGRLMRSDGTLNIDFAHVRKMVGGQHGESLLGTVEVAGDARPRALMDAIMKHPFLDAGKCFRKVKGLVISLIGSESLSMNEVQEFVEYIKAAAPEAQLALGVHIDGSLDNCVSAMVMFPYPDKALTGNESKAAEGKALQVNRLKYAANRDLQPSDAVGLKSAQQQLPLVSVSKGRFDKGEPNLYDGKDLDVPTFLRRNIVLI